MSKLFLSIASQLLVSFVASFTFITSVSANEVGSLPGEFNVSPSGAATYSVPIEVSPGVNGLQPSLALVYNSQSGNGLLGQGWGVSGLSSITRCPKTLEQDGDVTGINFTSSDRLCLDGQRLIPKNGSNSDAGYWGASEYRTEVDSFSKVTHYGAGFKVETKDGRVAEYGVTSDSTQNVAGFVNPLSWAVNKIRDQLNNTIIYSYYENTSNGDHKVRKISYTGVLSINLTNSIEFKYDPRSDVSDSYVGGAKVSLTERLSKVITKNNGQTVFEYNLTYGNVSPAYRSRITNINKCSGANGVNGCIKYSTDFAWSNQDVGLNGATNTYINNIGYNTNPHLMDVNGDGKSDLVLAYSSTWRIRFATDTGFGPVVNTGLPNSYYLIAQQINYDGDNKADLIINENSRWKILKGTESGFEKIDTGISSIGWNTNFKIADVNGDGLSDLVLAYSGTWHIRLNSVNGFGADINTGISNYSYAYAKVFDYDGDGKADVLVPRERVWKVLKSTGSNFELINTGINNIGYTTNPQLIDVNGDGLSDLVLAHSGKWHIRVNQGGKFGPEKDINYGNGSYKYTVPIDYNNDGRMDLLYPANYKWNVLQSNGEGFDYIVTNYSNIGFNTSTLVGDVNGDGLTELVLAYNSNWNIMFHKGDAAEHITSIKSGTGVTSTINYNPLTDGGVYTKDNSSSYPVMDLQTPIQVVSNVFSDNGLGGNNETRYKYTGLKVHQRGRGSLGFRQMETTNQQTGIKSKTDFSQEFPSVGAPVKTVVRQANGWVLSSSTSDFTYNGYTCVRYPVAQWSLPNCGSNKPGIVFPYSPGSTSTQYDLNRALIKTVKTNSTQGNFSDNFVASTTTTVTTTGTSGIEYKQVTTNTFGNSYSSVYFEKGQLTQKQSYSVDNGNYSPTITKVFTYNTKGKLLTDTLEPGTSDVLTKTYGYDNFGNRTSVEISGADITKRTSSTIYDNNGQFPKSVSNALEHSETHIYDPRFGKLTSRTGPNGLTTSYEFDSFGRKTATVNARLNRNEISRQWCNVSLGHVCTIPAINTGNSVQTASQSVSYIVTSRQKGSNLVEYAPPAKIYYDKFNREVRKESTGFDGVTVYVDTNYDSQGRVAAKTQPYFSDGTSDKNPTSFTYDVLGRVTNQYSPTGTRNQVLYNGLVVTTNSFVTSPSRTETKVETNNPIGQLISVRDNAYQTTRFGYNPQGKRTTTTDPLGNVITIGYDKFGRKISMTDPDMGQWLYTYNVLGELLTQKDAKLQLTSMQYDLLGRLTRRNDHDGLTSAWYYNDNGGTSSRTKGVGKLDYETSSNGYRKDLYYNNYGEPTTSIVAISGAGSSARTDTGYDAYGRINTITYPESIGRFQVKHLYKNGFLEKVTSSDNAITYWQADLRRANGQIQHDRYGANLEVSRDFDSGERIKWLNISASTMLYEAYYGYDSIGNIITRSSQRNQGSRVVFNENYTYDNLNRLTDVDMVGFGSITRSYDALGNIEHKNNNYYTYDANRPHAVKTALGNTYNYDANGNMLNGAGRSITWTSHNKPSRIVKGTSNSNFLYGPSRKRFYHQQTNGTESQNKTTYYIGKLFEKEIKGGVTEYKHYIRGGGKTIAVHTRKSGVANKTDYLLRDYQGSVVAIADETGNIKGHMDYDAFGARRPVQGLSQIDQIIQSFPRGYTGHEHLDNVGLIHMNGRVYDAVLGRFLSADPLVQAPNNLQSLNRYTYVFNNPMSYTDPSGFRSLRKKIRRALKVVAAITFPGAFIGYKLSTIKPVTKFFLKHKWAQVAGQVLATVYGGPAGAAGFSSYLTDISGGSFKDVLKSGAIAYVTASAFEAVNAHYGKVWNLGRVIDNGLVGGLASELGGGKFADGFKFNFITAAARYLYNATVDGERLRVIKFNKDNPGSNYDTNWNTDITMEAGEGVSLKPEGLSVVNPTYNNSGLAVGFKDAINGLSEGGGVSNVINSFPGGRALSVLHDIWGGQVPPDVFTYVTNVPSMFVAATVTYVGYADTFNSAGAYQVYKRR